MAPSADLPVLCLGDPEEVPIVPRAAVALGRAEGSLLRAREALARGHSDLPRSTNPGLVRGPAGG
jgi:hypothetical protein